MGMGRGQQLLGSTYWRRPSVSYRGPACGAPSPLVIVGGQHNALIISGEWGFIWIAAEGAGRKWGWATCAARLSIACRRFNTRMGCSVWIVTGRQRERQVLAAHSGIAGRSRGARV